MKNYLEPSLNACKEIVEKSDSKIQKARYKTIKSNIVWSVALIGCYLTVSYVAYGTWQLGLLGVILAVLRVGFQVAEYISFRDTEINLKQYATVMIESYPRAVVELEELLKNYREVGPVEILYTDKGYLVKYEDSPVYEVLECDISSKYWEFFELKSVAESKRLVLFLNGEEAISFDPA